MMQRKQSEMQEPELFIDRSRLFENLCDVNYLRTGFVAVKKNRGSPGIDGVTIDDFDNRLDEELAQLQMELRSWRYQPMPVRRVDIPKPGKTGEFRMLGVPAVRDRVVQSTLRLLLEPIFDPTFSDSSYGFRPGRNQKQAVEAAKNIAVQGKEFCADVDLSKFFDRVNHDRLIARIGLKVTDKRILRLIGTTLRSGIMKDGIVSATQEGTVQGSPLSPLLSNIVLDELDKELEKRGIEFARFADDCNAFFGSMAAAKRGMENMTRFIEGKLKLKINREKSQVAPTSKVKFLGATIIAGTIVISVASMNRAMDRVKELTPRGTHQSTEQAINSINQWYVGWANYYRMTQYPSQLLKIEAHIRRRLRSRFIDQQKNRRNLVKKLTKQGASPNLVKKHVYSNRGRWALSHTRAVEQAYSNQWFKNQGLKVMSDRKLEHWFEIKRWIKLT